MSDSDLPPIVYVLGVCCFCVAVSTCFGLGRGEALMRNEAVLKGHAEWVADKEGNAQFKWKEAK
jgi:hypothetical protein